MIRVLLADDQALLRMGLRMVIESEDDLSIVGEANDGAEAIQLAGELLPDVVLMDVRMPGTDGITATQQITGSHPDIKVIILTTFDLDQYVLDGLRAGASGFLLKDATPEQLADAIRSVARGDSVLAPAATRRLIAQFVTNPAVQPAATTPTTPLAGQPPLPPALAELTEREREVFGLLARGQSNREIAADLYVSEHTIKVHVGRILAKLSLRDRVQVVLLAHELGILRPNGDTAAAPW